MVSTLLDEGTAAAEAMILAHGTSKKSTFLVDSEGSVSHDVICFVTSIIIDSVIISIMNVPLI